MSKIAATNSIQLAAHTLNIRDGTNGVFSSLCGLKIWEIYLGKFDLSNSESSRLLAVSGLQFVHRVLPIDAEQKRT